MRAARGRVRRELEQLGIRLSHASDAPVWILVSLLAIAAAAASIGAATRSLTAQAAVALSAVVVTVAGLLVALLQWRQGLAEKAFDALSERIALANKMRLEAFKDLEIDEEQEVARRPELYRFFVFSEIDSLEYAGRRYRFGLGLNADIVDRAVRHFRSRCGSETFRDVAVRCAEEGAYFEDTKQAVRSILREEGSRQGAHR